MNNILLLIFLVVIGFKSTTNGQSIGYGLPNFGLYYNPYTSPAFGYGLGPQFSTLRGSLAAGLLYGGHSHGMGGMGGYGMGYGGGLGAPGLMGLAPGLGLATPLGPYGLNSQPWLNQYHGKYGPYGRYPGQTGTYGFGSNGGYGIYNGYGVGSGGGYPLGPLSGHGDLDNFVHRDSPSDSNPPLNFEGDEDHGPPQRINSKLTQM